MLPSVIDPDHKKPWNGLFSLQVWLYRAEDIKYITSFWEQKQTDKQQQML